MYCRSCPWRCVVIAGNSTPKCETRVSNCPDASSVEQSLSGVGRVVSAVRPNSGASEIHGEWSLSGCSGSSVSTRAQQARGVQPVYTQLKCCSLVSGCTASVWRRLRHLRVALLQHDPLNGKTWRCRLALSSGVWVAGGCPTGGRLLPCPSGAGLQPYAKPGMQQEQASRARQRAPQPGGDATKV